MAIRRKSGSLLYLIFRIVAASDRKTKPVFLTDEDKWSPRRAYARKGTFTAMKSVVSKLKADFPDLILEQCRD